MPRLINISRERLVRRVPAPSGRIQPVLGVDPQPHSTPAPRSRLIAMEGRFVGATAPALVIPGGVAPGDYAIVAHYRGFNISGGAGAAWTSTAFVGDMVIEHRALLAGDLLAALPFSTATPYCSAFLRVSRPVTSLQLRTSLAYSGSAGAFREIPGFEKSDDVMAVIGASTISDAGGVTLDTRQWPRNTSSGRDSWWSSLHVQDRPRTIIDNSPFLIQGNIAGVKTGAVFELRG